MKTLQVSDEVYLKLLEFVVDPFEDTADVVISRVTEIAKKAKDQYSHIEARRRNATSTATSNYTGPERRAERRDDSIPLNTRIPLEQPEEEVSVIL